MNEEMNENLPVRETDYTSRNPIIIRDIHEDRLLQVSEENVALKRHLRKQEDRIRQLATKLVRVIGEKSKRNKRDNILIEELKSRIGELEGQVNHLRSKLTVARQQLGSYTKLVPGVPRNARPKSRNSIGTPTGKFIVPDEVTRLLIDAKSENHALKDQLNHMHDRWSRTNEELVALREQLKLKEVEYSDEVAAARSQAHLETEVKHKKIAENIQFIRLQRDSKRTASWLATYEAQCRTLETNFNAATENVSQLELQVATLQDELRNERTQVLNLRKQLEENGSSMHQLREANAQLTALEDENKILREGNATFLAKSLESCDRLKQIDHKENELKAQIEHMENTIKAEQKAKSDIISALTQEKTKCLSLEQSIKVLDKKCAAASSQLTSVTEELKQARSKLLDASKPEVIIQKELITAPCENCTVKDAEFNQIKLQLAQLRGELGKTKDLLKTQISINKEYQEEIEALTSQMSHAEHLHQKERKELMDIFTEKTNKMAELEESLEALRIKRSGVPAQAFVSYDNKLIEESKEEEDPDYFIQDDELPSLPEKVLLKTAEEAESPRCETNDQVTGTSELKDQNLVENPNDLLQETLSIHILNFVPFNNEALPSLFLTWEHEDLPRQYSPIVTGGIFNYKSVHAVDKKMRKSNILISLHQAILEADAQTLAVGMLDLEQSSSFIVMKSIENDEEIGKLFCNYTFSSHPYEEETNNNSEKSDALPEIPIPFPRRKITHDADSVLQAPPINTTTKPESHDPEPSPAEVDLPHQHSSDSDSRSKAKRKSILRREINSSKPDKRRVRVSDNIQQRTFDSDSDGKFEHLDSEASTVTEFSQFSSSQSLGQIRHEIVEVTVHQEHENDIISSGQLVEKNESVNDMESEISEKRRARRELKRLSSEDWDEASATLSVGSEGETSKNISDIETSSEQSFFPPHDSEITIEVIYVKFTKHTSLLDDPSIKNIFVEYHFLNYSAEELETEPSLPKPQLGRKAQFNFKKTFLIDTREKQKLLQEMIVNDKRLQFTVVTEPGDNDTINCEDVGYAFVSITDILNTGNDISKKEIPLFDAQNSSLDIGVLCVSVIAFKTLNAL